MRVATWNVNSAKQRLPRLLPWLDRRQPDVVCLQETKLADVAFDELLADELAARGYAVARHGEAQWNGVAILSRSGLEEVTVGIPVERRSSRPDGPAGQGCARLQPPDLTGLTEHSSPIKPPDPTGHVGPGGPTGPSNRTLRRPIRPGMRPVG